MSETLVVVSKVKAFIKQQADMNTSASAVDEISRIVEKECLKAIEKARQDKRKTVMDRDFGGEDITPPSPCHGCFGS